MCVAAAIAGAAVIGAVGSSMAADKSASAQKSAAKTASDTQMAMFNQIQANEAPWVNTGQAATTALAQFYGLPMYGPTTTSDGSVTTAPTTGVAGTPSLHGSVPPSRHSLLTSPGQAITTNGSSDTASQTSPATQTSTPDYNKILSNLPGYQFQLDQGTQAVQRNLAAQGLLQSGAAGKALTQYGQGLAQNYAGQYAGGLATLSQLGEAGAAGVASAGINAANQIGSNQIYAGNATAAGYANTANAINSGLGGLVSAYGYSRSPYGNPYGGNPYGPSAAGFSSYTPSALDTQEDPGLYSPAGGGGYTYSGLN